MHPFISAIAADGATPSDWVGYLVQWGPPGAVLGLLLTGILEPKRVRLGLEKDRDDWREAFETERTAHSTTREALTTANARAEAALESANTMTRILEQIGHPTKPPTRR